MKKSSVNTFAEQRRLSIWVQTAVLLPEHKLSEKRWILKDLPLPRIVKLLPSYCQSDVCCKHRYSSEGKNTTHQAREGLGAEFLNAQHCMRYSVTTQCLLILVPWFPCDVSLSSLSSLCSTLFNLFPSHFSQPIPISASPHLESLSSEYRWVQVSSDIPRLRWDLPRDLICSNWERDRRLEVRAC